MRGILLFFILFSISIYTRAEKKSTPLNSLKWYTVEEKFSSADEFRASINHAEAVVGNEFKVSPGKSYTFSTIVESPSDPEARLFFEIENKSPLPQVYIDGQLIENQKQDASFVAGISNAESREELLLTLNFDTQPNDTETSLNSYFEGFSLSTLNGISIAWCTSMKDPFFGGYLLEVHIWNLFTKDIDGKLMARISDAVSFEQIAENNNCAFSRCMTEAVIDINFPEAKEKLTPGKYIVEVVLVDKENNEEIVDKLSAPVWLY
jgi:hypothetical protein